MELHSHIADTTFCQFLKLNNDIMRYNTMNSKIFARVLFSRNFIKPCKMAKSFSHLLIEVNLALVKNFSNH